MSALKPIKICESTSSKLVNNEATIDNDSPVMKTPIGTKYSFRQSIYNRTGYMITSKIENTIQGSIYNGIHDVLVSIQSKPIYIHIIINIQQ